MLFIIVQRSVTEEYKDRKEWEKEITTQQLTQVVWVTAERRKQGLMNHPYPAHYVATLLQLQQDKGRELVL